MLRGTFLNDLHLAVALRRARDTGWVVRTNPYEGGSDHTSFTKAGVPALLNWHFTDRYYHTNLDTIDKVSAVTMGHVATVVATTAVAALMRSGWPARHPSPKKSPGPSMATTASFPVEDNTVSFTAPLWR